MEIKARYPGTCSECGKSFTAGTLILFSKLAARGSKTSHVDCGAPEDRSDVSNVIRTSGGTFYRNRNGRCEDAPCCGCCTI